MSSSQHFGRAWLHTYIHTGVLYRFACLPACLYVGLVDCKCCFFVLFCFLIIQLKCFSVTLDSQHRTGCRVVKCHSLSRNGLPVRETGKSFHRCFSHFPARNALKCTEQVARVSVGWLLKICTRAVCFSTMRQTSSRSLWSKCLEKLLFQNGSVFYGIFVCFLFLFLLLLMAANKCDRPALS